MSMCEKLRLDQVFYGSGPKGYDILATSFAEVSCAWSAVNACLAIGLVPGSGLPKPILLSRILDDRIVMAKICNGAKDSSGRNTLFIHALVSTTQEARLACVSTFSLADSGAFCDKVSDSSDKPLFVDAASSVVSKSQESLELPAAIETSEPNEKLLRRIVAGQENELSWSTFAFEDMPGYDVICISNIAPRPSGRAIYGSDLRLLRHRLNGNKLDYGGVRLEASVTAEDIQRSSLPSRNVCSSNGQKRKNNKTFGALLVSLALNFALLAIVFRMLQGETKDVRVSRASDASLERKARSVFTDDTRVTDEDLKKCGYPLQGIFLNEGDVAEEKPEQVELFRRLLAYRDFVEEVIKPKKEK